MMRDSVHLSIIANKDNLSRDSSLGSQGTWRPLSVRNKHPERLGGYPLLLGRDKHRPGGASGRGLTRGQSLGRGLTRGQSLGRGLTWGQSLGVWPGHGEALGRPGDPEKVVRGVPLGRDEDGLPGR